MSAIASRISERSSPPEAVDEEETASDAGAAPLRAQPSSDSVRRAASAGPRRREEGIVVIRLARRLEHPVGDEGVRAALLAEGGERPVPGHEGDVPAQRPELLTNRS